MTEPGRSPVTGHLPRAGDAPTAGERTRAVLEAGGVRVSAIVSAADGAAGRVFVGDDDEWVTVVSGSATLSWEGTAGSGTVNLGPGDWVWLPAGVPHRVVRNEAGTVWLAVHVPPGTARFGRHGTTGSR